MWEAVAFILLLGQLPAALVLLARLSKGPSRRPPVAPRRPQLADFGCASVVVPTLNEALRIGPCLEGLSRQGFELREVIVVDSRSTDGTGDLVRDRGRRDPRLRLMTDDPLPAGWVGRPWALQSGFEATNPASRWVLGIDADTQPQPGLIAGAIAAAEAEDFDIISLSPRFILKYPGECLLQPALLMTLVYRFGPTGSDATGAERVMANGQCFLARRDRLAAIGGYGSARRSFCDDVTLARHAAASGLKVGFLDGSKVIKVRMYDGAAETWREWGRSLDLKDASSRGQLWGDLWLLTAVQGLPLPLTILWGSAIALSTHPVAPVLWTAFGLNSFLLLIRIALNWAIAGSYDLSGARGAWLFYCSAIADPLAALRIGLSSVQTPSQWRGRQYDATLGEAVD